MKLRYIPLLAAGLLVGCEGPLDTNPTAQIDAGQALTTARGIELAVTGAYDALQDGSLYSRELVAYPELYADNLAYHSTFTSDGEFENRNVMPSNAGVLGVWTAAYRGINRANNVLASIPEVAELTAEQAAQYRGEVLFLRALNYSNLVRWFGGVPLVLEPSRGVGEEAYVSRATQEQVYAQIEADLQEAAGLLPASTASARATRGAANALLARVYLEQHKDALARDKATEVIAAGYQLVENYRDLFTIQNSTEAIFEIQYSVNDGNSLAYWHFPQELGGRYGFVPSDALMAAYQAGDARRDASVAHTESGERFGIKYYRISSGADNVLVLRLAEMYLIRAEANARLGELPSLVRADINRIRQRAGLAPLLLTVDTQAELIDAVLQERRVEFAMEGHRFFDLRRNGRAQTVLDLTAERLVLPLPQAELDVNPNLEQNPGY